MSLHFKTRIALFNTAAGAIVTLLVFVVVYSVVYITAYRHLDSEIRVEQNEIFSNIRWKADSLILDMMSEWEEKEHQQADVSQVFLQLVDAKGRLAFRSANLLNDHLLFADPLNEVLFSNITLNGKPIRQGMFPIFNDKGILLGQLDIGIPQVESTMILANLRLTLCIAFPLMLLVFYFVSDWAASAGISPVYQLIRTTEKITDTNISTRIPLPTRKDEIYNLTTTINEFLRRIEVGLNREKQITADISHELRTPITSIRGTLEVLIRKNREPVQYEEKIRQVIREVDALNFIIDQLLQLSRLEAGILSINKTNIGLNALIQSINKRWQPRLNEKKIHLKVDIKEDVKVSADQGFLEIMIENIISNAVKYSNTGELITCKWNLEENSLFIIDNGPGIEVDQIPYLFNRFYRTDASRSSVVQGTGLGLSIVKTLADLQGIIIRVNSRPGEGTTFILKFNT